MVCVMATVPLAVGYSAYSYISAGVERSVAYIAFGTWAVLFVALQITLLSALIVGIPIYLLTSKVDVIRPLALIVTAIIAGVLILRWWTGEFDDIRRVLMFAFFGAYSGVAFWLGADVWRLIK